MHGQYDPLEPALLMWIDIEFTGLNPESDSILEIAARITDRNLEAIGSDFSETCLPVGFDSSALASIVHEMHTKNGLLDDVMRSILNETGLEEKFLEWIADRAQEGPLVHAGYYLAKDREFVSLRMPKLAERLGFRTLDVRTLEEAADAWTPHGRFARGGNGNHRALGDVKDAIRLAAEYRRYFSALT